jgi:hypothetical protein
VGISPSEIKLAAHVVEEVIDATAQAIHQSPTASRLLEASGLHVPHISAPAILGERIGSMLTPDKIRNFAEDLFGRLDQRPLPDLDLIDRYQKATWNFGKKQATVEKAIVRAGFEVGDLQNPIYRQNLYSALEGAPDARGALTSFANANREFRETSTEYRTTVFGPKFADTYGATSQLVTDSGLIRPKLKISYALGNAEASYGNGVVKFAPKTFDDSAVDLVDSAAHEFTHLEQDQLHLFYQADLLNVGSQATPQQSDMLVAWFHDRGRDLPPEAIKQGLVLRAGRHLTDEAAERAHSTLDSMESILKMQTDNWADHQHFRLASNLYRRAADGGDKKNVAIELADPTTGLKLNNQLFGDAYGPKFFAKYTEYSTLSENFSLLTGKVKRLFNTELLNDLGLSADLAKIKLRPYHEAYRQAPHELEAFANGQLAASFRPSSIIRKGGLFFEDP